MAVIKQYTSVNDYSCDLNIDAVNVDKPIVTIPQGQSHTYTQWCTDNAPYQSTCDDCQFR